MFNSNQSLRAKFSCLIIIFSLLIWAAVCPAGYTMTSSTHWIKGIIGSSTAYEQTSADALSDVCQIGSDKVSSATTLSSDGNVLNVFCQATGASYVNTVDARSSVTMNFQHNGWTIEVHSLGGIYEPPGGAEFTFTLTDTTTGTLVCSGIQSSYYSVNPRHTYQLYIYAGTTVDPPQIYNGAEIRVILIIPDPVTRDVPSQYPSIQAAIDASSNGDTVVVAPGTYYENINFNGKNITLSSSDPNDPNIGATTIIDVNDINSVIRVMNVSAAINGFTITNGLAENGGAIFIQDSNLNVSNCILTNNKTLDGQDVNTGIAGDAPGHGGAIYCIGSSLVLTDCNISDNAAGAGGDCLGGDYTSMNKAGKGGHGGAVYCKDSIDINLINCTFHGNEAGNGGSSVVLDSGYGGNGGSGGAIYNLFTPIQIINCTLENNYGGNGGYSSKGFGYDVNEFIPSEGGSGGAIYSSGNLTIINSIILNNKSGDAGNRAGTMGDTTGEGGSGGGISCSNAALNIIQCQIIGNTSGHGGDSGDSRYGLGKGGDGGGICCISVAPLNIVDSNIQDNNSGTGGNCAPQFSFEYGGSGGNGGGIFLSECPSPFIERCNISNNETGLGGHSWYLSGASGSGGGIYSDDSVSLNKCIVSNNIAQLGIMCSGHPGNGGGIYADSTIINDSSIIGNRTGSGCDNSDDTCASSGGDGGGIYSQSVIVANSLIMNNITGNGGGNGSACNSAKGGNGAGIWSSAGSISNSMFIKNATGKGGDSYWYNGANGGDGAGLYCAECNILNCTIVSNITGEGGQAGEGKIDGSVGLGGGIYTGANSNIISSIIWGNTYDELYGYDCNNVSYCDINNGICAGLNGNISVDPFFFNPDNNDFHLLAASLCINAGDPTYQPKLGETDYEGGQRIVNGRIDIGASEYNVNRSDFNIDRFVNFEDFSIFAFYWLEQVCLEPGWCQGCDYDHSGSVDIEDLSRFTQDWLWTPQQFDINLIAYLKFNDANGEIALDSSNYNNKGQLNNDPVWQENSLSFNGVDDWVQVNVSNTLHITNQLTVSAWVYFDNTPTQWTKIVIKPYTSYDDPYELFCLDFGHQSGSSEYNVPRFIISDGTPGGDYGYAFDSSYTLSAGQWYQITGTYDGNAVSLYINGQLTSSNPVALTIGNNSMPISIGGRLGTDDNFNGSLKNVRIYNRSLSSDEVLQLYIKESLL